MARRPRSDGWLPGRDVVDDDGHLWVWVEELRAWQSIIYAQPVEATSS